MSNTQFNRRHCCDHTSSVQSLVKKEVEEKRANWESHKINIKICLPMIIMIVVGYIWMSGDIFGWW